MKHIQNIERILKMWQKTRCYSEKTLYIYHFNHRKYFQMLNLQLDPISIKLHKVSENHRIYFPDLFNLKNIYILQMWGQQIFPKNIHTGICTQAKNKSLVSCPMILTLHQIFIGMCWQFVLAGTRTITTLARTVFRRTLKDFTFLICKGSLWLCLGLKSKS